MRRLSIGALLVVLGACGQEESPTVVPLPTPPSGARARAPIAEEPSPLIVAPHVARTEPTGGHAAADPAPSLGGGGGGGGGGDWTPRPPPPPSQREVDEFRERLEQEMAEVDREGDPCEQLRDALRAGAEAHDPSGRPDVPSLAEMRRRCRTLPETYLNCLTPDYHQQHAEECMAELERMAARGRRRTEQARRRVDAMRRGNLSASEPDDDGEPEDG